VKPLWAFLSLASLIAIVALLWENPEARDRISSVVLGQPVSVSQPVEQPAEAPEKPEPKKPVKAFRKAPVPVSATVQPAPVTAPEAAKPKDTVSGPEAVPSQVNVKADSAAVYSFNSPRSPVVRVLRKGERVETNIEVIDSGGRWSLIQAEQLRSGFVRSENLERQQMASRK
jgi:hypothetical protein